MKKIILSISFIVCQFLFLPYSISMASEEASYEVVHKTNIYEVRYYNDRLAVQASYTNQNSSFRNLFNYISGANQNSKKIKLTCSQYLKWKS